MSGVLKLFDPNTQKFVGEVAQTYERVKTRHPYRKWFVLNMNAMNLMISCKRSDDLRVWLELSRIQDKENMVKFTNLELAERLDMYPSQVSAALIRLRANRVLISNKHGHKLAPGLQWMGDTKKFPKEHHPIGKAERYDPDAKWSRKDAMA